MKTITTLMMAACVSVGCGGGTDRLFSIDPQKELKDLTAEERIQLCEELNTTRQSRISWESSCTLVGVMIATAKNAGAESCRTAFSDCMAEGPGAVSCKEAGQEPLNCSVTVSELEKCLVDVIDIQVTLFDSLSCSDVAGSYQKYKDYLDLISKNCINTITDSCVQAPNL